MKILITGIYGFLGNHLANKLVEKHTVVGLFNNSRNKSALAIVCHNDLDAIDFVPDAIIMCHAAVASGANQLDNKKLFETNVLLTERIVEKFPKVKTIYISSVSVFGNQNAVHNEESVPQPMTAYALSKLWGEHVAKKNPKAIIIRFSSLYGQNMKENTLLPNYCSQAIQNKVIEVWGDGMRKQNYLYIEDAVALISKALETNKIIEIPLLGTATKEYSNIEIAKILEIEVPASIIKVGVDNSTSYHYDNSITRTLLDWEPKMPLSEGIKQYLEWKEKQS